MNRRETGEAMIASLVAFTGDVLALYGGLMLAQWLRFESGWFIMRHDAPPFTHQQSLALWATLVFIVSFRFCGLYKRPHTGRFEEQIPRIIKAILLGYILYLAFEQVRRADPDFSRTALVVGFFTITFLVLLQRYILYRIEWHYARHLPKIHRVLLIGNDDVADRLCRSIAREPFLRSDVIGFLRTTDESLPEGLCEAECLGTVDDLPNFLNGACTQVVLTDVSLKHERMVELIVSCEKHLVAFKLVPDLFRILTADLDVQNIAGVPVMGLRKWPLDFPWNRFRKRLFDLLGGIIGCIVFAPVMVVAALLIKASSPGPVLYQQKRYGEDGAEFTMLKLRTMHVDADKDGPGWTKENDPRRTRFGSAMRSWNIDELPQFWNVVRGDMSLVGPRPEQPFFVEQFKEAINRYMIRHVSKPGITGWAQVNGLRGDTSIEERIKFDLYYLENWSLSFDFKIILRTVFARKNAY